MAFVVDASVAIAWFVKSQATEYTNALLRWAAAERLQVPALWHAEFASVLLALAHRRKLDPARLEVIFASIDAKDWKTDAAPPSARARGPGAALLALRVRRLVSGARIAACAPDCGAGWPLCKAAPCAGVAIA